MSRIPVHALPVWDQCTSQTFSYS